MRIAHTETCGICHSIFCPSCLSFHSAQHPKAASERAPRSRRMAATESHYSAGSGCASAKLCRCSLWLLPRVFQTRPVDVVRFLRDAVYEQEDCERVHAACDRMEEFEARNWYNYTARVRLTFPQYWVSTFLKAWPSHSTGSAPF